MMQTLLKAGGMVLILFCTTSIGMALARELSRRVEQLETAVTMLDAFEGCPISGSLETGGDTPTGKSFRRGRRHPGGAFGHPWTV